MTAERVRIALDVCMDDDPEVQYGLAEYLGVALIEAALAYGVDLGQSSMIIVTRCGGDTDKIPITEGGDDHGVDR